MSVACSIVSRPIVGFPSASKAEVALGRAPATMCLHLAQDCQRRSVNYSASFDQVSIVLGEQRLKWQFPELVIRHDHEVRFPAQQIVRRFNQKIMELAS